MKAGAPVKILATVEVNFRFPGLWFDEKTERQRTAFNVALQTLNQPKATSAAVDRAVQSMTDLRRGRGQAFWRDGEGFNVSLSDDKNCWHDFVSGEGGGVLDLVQQVRGGSRAEALQFVSDVRA